jgi:hypothetical protein
MIVIKLSIDGTPVTWPDGSGGLVHQMGWELDTHESTQAYLAVLVVDHHGRETVHGTLRMTDANLIGLPGRGQEERSEVVKKAFMARVKQHGLAAGFALQVFLMPGLSVEIGPR